MLFFNLLFIFAIIGAQLIDKVKQPISFLEGNDASNSNIEAYEDNNDNTIEYQEYPYLNDLLDFNF